VVLGEGVGSAVLAEGKGFADVSAFRRGLRPPCPRLRSSHEGRPSRAVGQPSLGGPCWCRC